MAVCTFFGHRDAPEKIALTLKSTLIDLIENREVDLFYVGSQGHFDYMVKNCLESLKQDYPYINYAVVLAYIPGKEEPFNQINYGATIYPEGLENTPLKFAIDKRNHWMINHADYVVTYVKHNIGGAAKFQKLAERKGKEILNIGSKEEGNKKTP